MTDDLIEEEDIAVPAQTEIHVFINERGAITIKSVEWPDDDAIIVIEPVNVPRLCAALMRAAEQIGMDDDDPEQAAIPATPPPPKPPSSAERQRRYRNRHRNGDAERDVTHNGTSDVRDVTDEAGNDEAVTLFGDAP